GNGCDLLAIITEPTTSNMPAGLRRAEDHLPRIYIDAGTHISVYNLIKKCRGIFILSKLDNVRLFTE
ncbi:hypothetical protein LIZ76_18025, partial [Caldibacillus sp. 210928-DFI.2.22]|uniref:hypothetical protein n=1 Tax=Caldibacillus sp. 210928-DFI.2.22 TaxID=2883265 RepID=UPI001D071416